MDVLCSTHHERTLFHRPLAPWVRRRSFNMIYLYANHHGVGFMLLIINVSWLQTSLKCALVIFSNSCIQASCIGLLDLLCIGHSIKITKAMRLNMTLGTGFHCWPQQCPDVSPWLDICSAEWSDGRVLGDSHICLLLSATDKLRKIQDLGAILSILLWTFGRIATSITSSIREKKHLDNSRT